MKRGNVLFQGLSAVIGLFIILLNGCNEPRLKSKWLDRNIAIDGIDKEWENCRLYYEKNTRSTIGLYNDKEYLYINFDTSDPSIQHQMIEQGFTVWFDPTGGKEKRLGIFYPTGIMMDRKMPGKPFERGKPSVNGENGENTSQGPPEFGDKDDRHFNERKDQHPSILLGDQMDHIIDAIDIKIPDGIGGWDRMFLDKEDNKGIQAKAKHAQGRLVYELKIPLAKNDSRPYGIFEATATRYKKVSIGFETENPDMGKIGGKRDRSSRRSPGGGMDGPDGGMGGPGGGMGGSPGGGMERPGEGMGGPGNRGGNLKNQKFEPLELWVKAELAQKP